MFKDMQFWWQRDWKDRQAGLVGNKAAARILIAKKYKVNPVGAERHPEYYKAMQKIIDRRIKGRDALERSLKGKSKQEIKMELHIYDSPNSNAFYSEERRLEKLYTKSVPVVVPAQAANPAPIPHPAKESNMESKLPEIVANVRKAREESVAKLEEAKKEVARLEKEIAVYDTLIKGTAQALSSAPIVRVPVVKHMKPAKSPAVKVVRAKDGRLKNIAEIEAKVKAERQQRAATQSLYGLLEEKPGHYTRESLAAVVSKKFPGASLAKIKNTISQYISPSRGRIVEKEGKLRLGGSLSNRGVFVKDKAKD